MSTIKMIYDADYNEENYLDGFLESMGICKSAYDLTPQVWKEDLNHYINEEKIIEYDDEIANIVCYEAKNGKKLYVIKASLGLWDGVYEGGKVIEGMENVILKCSGGEEFFKFYMEGRLMKFLTSHHDGINNFWIKELTERGEKYYEAHKNEMGDREMAEKLYNDRHLSRHVTIWHNIYGM